MKTFKMISIAAAVLALAVTGCKKDDDGMDPEPQPTPNARTFNVKMTDAPANFSRLDVTIDGVEAYHDSQGWITLSSETHAVNILSLANGTSMSLATATDVETGHYSRLRVHFSEQSSVTVNAQVQIGSLVIAAGGNSTMTWGGAQDRYVEIMINEEVSATAGADVLLDFDAAQSVYEGANFYIIDPVITEMQNTTTGVRGTIAGADAAAFITITNGSNTYSAYSTASGAFLISGMQEGTYSATIIAYVRNAAGVMEQQNEQRTNIAVAGGAIVNIGTVNF